MFLPHGPAASAGGWPATRATRGRDGRNGPPRMWARRNGRPLGGAVVEPARCGREVHPPLNTCYLRVEAAVEANLFVGFRVCVRWSSALSLSLSLGRRADGDNTPTRWPHRSSAGSSQPLPPPCSFLHRPPSPPNFRTPSMHFLIAWMVLPRAPPRTLSSQRRAGIGSHAPLNGITRSMAAFKRLHLGDDADIHPSILRFIVRMELAVLVKVQEGRNRSCGARSAPPLRRTLSPSPSCPS